MIMFDEREAEGIDTTEKLENVIQKKLNIDGWSEQKIFDWAEEIGLLHTLKDSDFFYDETWDRPFLNRHTLEYILYDDCDPDFLYEEIPYLFEEKYEIAYEGTAHIPYWLDGYDEDCLVQHVTGYVNYDIGDTKNVDELYFEDTEYERYKVIDIIGDEFEVEFRAENGESVPYVLADETLII